MTSTMSPAAPRFTDIGARIREARQDAGLTQDAFATAISTSRRHVMRLERGDHRPSRPMLDRIAEVTDRVPSFFEALQDEDYALYSDLVGRLLAATRVIVAAEVAKAVAK